MYAHLTGSRICVELIPLRPLLGVKNYLNTDFVMYIRLMRFVLRVNLASPANLGDRDYLNNYFALYARLTRSRIRLQLTYPAYSGLRLI